VKKYEGVSYLWGGRSPFGIDCSGLVQMVFKICRIFLPRDSAQQVLQGTTINFIHEAKEGDLAFFGNEEGRIIHVGIILNHDKIIHASGKVRIDNIDHQGIFNAQLNKYTHQLRVIKSFFD
jgi:cell wall-associated NlpC family hydrolase